MDFGFVRCLTFSNYFKLFHVLGRVLHELHFLICSLMAVLPDFETFKRFPAFILKCLADVPTYVTFTSCEQVGL